MGQDEKNSGTVRADIFRFILKCRGVLARRKGIFLIIFLTVLIGGVIVMSFQKKTYEAMAIVQILHESPNALGYKELTKNEVKDFEDVNTQLNMFSAKSLLLSILGSLDCQDRKDLLSPYFKNWTWIDEADVGEFILERRKVNLLRKSYIVNISFSHCSSTVAAMMANKFADFFCDFSIKTERDVILKSITDLTDKISAQRKVIEDQERRLSKYRETCGAISLDSKDDVAHQQLAVINNALVNKRLEYDLFKNSCLLIEEYRKKGKQLMTLPFVCSNSYVENVLSNLSKQRAEVSSLAEKYGDNHPIIVCENSKLKQLQSELDSAMAFVIDGIGSKKTKAKREYQLLSEKLKQKESEIIELSRVAVEYNSLLRDLTVALNLYNTINSRLHEQIAQLNLLMPNVIVIDRALPPDRPVWPNFKLEISVFLLLGLMFGLLYIVVAEIFDDRIRTREDIHKLFGGNMLGFIRMANQREIEAAMAALAIRIDSELKNHGLDAVNVVGQPGGLSWLTSSFMSLGGNVLVVTDRPITILGKRLVYKEIDGVVGHIGAIDERSDVLILSKSGSSFNERAFEYLQEVRREYDRVIISFSERDAYKAPNPLDDSLILFFIKINSTRTMKLINYMGNTYVSPEKMYCIVFS
ncbi:MAG: hypothetical protein LBB20_02155 [Puniceicoccales bacterium]|jgi:uncharacterized protein involved in exopolysaccharide biosynthesis|nr:hypothetical protein [Puniceicoccales bacterium]